MVSIAYNTARTQAGLPIEQQVVELQAKVAQYEAIIAQDDLILSDTSLSPAERITYRVIHKAYQAAIPNDAGIVQIHRAPLAEAVGVSETSITRLVKRLADAGKLERESVDYTGHDGKVRGYLGVKLNDTMAQVDFTSRDVGVSPSDILALSLNHKGAPTEVIPAQVQESVHSEPALPALEDVESSPSDKMSLNLNHKGAPTLPSSGPRPRKKAQEQAEALHVPDEYIDFLCKLAGSDRECIAMNPPGKAKYTNTHRRFSREMACDHILGKRTYGTMLRHAGSLTCIVMGEADNQADWDIIRRSAKLIDSHGYRMLIEPSPGGFGGHVGGHMFSIFDRPVDARAVWQHWCQIAPELRQIKEHWPNGDNRVRLPAGVYRYREEPVCCVLLDADGVQLSQDGLGGVQAMMQYQTLDSLVPRYVPEPSEPREATRPAATPSGQHTIITSANDLRWQARYGEKNSFTREFTISQITTWFNATHRVEDILPPENNRYGLAHWRDERTASVFLDREHNTWCDFGAGGLLDGGTHDGGDAFDLYCRVHGLERKDAARQLAREFNVWAEQEEEKAARRGEPMPAQVLRYCTFSERGRLGYRLKLVKAGTAPLPGTQPTPSPEPRQAPPFLDFFTRKEYGLPEEEFALA